MDTPRRAFNLGDVLLQQILAGCLRSYGRLSVQSDPNAGIYGRAKRYRELLLMQLAVLKAVSRRYFHQDVCATVILPPGQSLTKSLAAAPRVAQQLAYLSLLRVLGIRIVSLGRDFSSTTGINWLQELWLSHIAHEYTLRDTAALLRAHAMGIRKAAWFPDLSWLAPLPPSTAAFAGRSSVVLSFRAGTDRLRWDDRLASEILERLDEFLDEACALGLKKVILIQHSSQDQAITMQIERKYQGRRHIQREPGLLSLTDIPHVYGSAALVISNRLHSLLLGLQWGGVPLAVIRASEPEKVRNQFLDLNLAEHIVDLAAPNLGQGIVERVLNRHNAVQEAVATYRQRAVSIARQTLAALFASEAGSAPPRQDRYTRAISTAIRSHE
jgi:polysaccharide pyruvyl transferase WcaK-like protein